jgi:hypothetical protein
VFITDDGDSTNDFLYQDKCFLPLKIDEATGELPGIYDLSTNFPRQVWFPFQLEDAVPCTGPACSSS